jgi:hypothetical protein
MRQRNRQILRFFLVLALGAGLAGVAGQSARSEKPSLRAEKARPQPIILATVLESAIPDECLLVPRGEEDNSATSTGKSGAKAADPRDNGARAKKKVIACG